MSKGTSLCYEKLGFKGPLENEEEVREQYKKALDVFVNSGFMLKNESFAAGGDKLTIADYAIWPNLVFVQVLKVYELPVEVIAYIERCEKACPAMKEARKPYEGFAATKM